MASEQIWQRVRNALRPSSVQPFVRMPIDRNLVILAEGLDAIDIGDVVALEIRDILFLLSRLRQQEHHGEWRRVLACHTGHFEHEPLRRFRT